MRYEQPEVKQIKTKAKAEEFVRLMRRAGKSFEQIARLLENRGYKFKVTGNPIVAMDAMIRRYKDKALSSDVLLARKQRVFDKVNQGGAK